MIFLITGVRIADFSLLFMQKLQPNPLLPLSQQPPLKVEILSSRPFLTLPPPLPFENLVGGSTHHSPPPSRKCGMHTMNSIYKFSPILSAVLTYAEK